MCFDGRTAGTAIPVGRIPYCLRFSLSFLFFFSLSIYILAALLFFLISFFAWPGPVSSMILLARVVSCPPHGLRCSLFARSRYHATWTSIAAYLHVTPFSFFPLLLTFSNLPRSMDVPLLTTANLNLYFLLQKC